MLKTPWIPARRTRGSRAFFPRVRRAFSARNAWLSSETRVLTRVRRASKRAFHWTTTRHARPTRGKRASDARTKRAAAARPTRVNPGGLERELKRSDGKDSMNFFLKTFWIGK